MPHGLPRVRAAQPLPREVRQDPGAEVVVVAVGHDDEPPAVGLLSQDLADGERGLGGPDADALAAVLDVWLEGAGPVLPRTPMTPGG